MARCFPLQMDAGCDGLIVCGSLGEGPMLSHAEPLEDVDDRSGVAGDKPSLMTEQRARPRRSGHAGENGRRQAPTV